MQKYFIILFLVLSGCGGADDFPEPSESPTPSESPAPEPVCLNEECTVLSQGPNNAGTGADDASVGTLTWSNPGNIVSSNDSRATTSGVDTNDTHYLKATNFSFSIPSNAVIRGVVVDVEGNTDISIPVEFFSLKAKVVLAGTVSGNQLSGSGGLGYQDVDVTKTRGSSSDTGGLTFYGYDVNSSSFGVAIYGSLTATQIIRVDNIKLTIYYDLTGDLGLTW